MTVSDVTAPPGGPRERACWLRAGAETIFALATEPAAGAGPVGVLLVHSGTHNFSAHRNATWTRLARRLADEGCASLRFDFAGTGESSGELALDRYGQPTADTVAGLAALRELGCRRLLLVGSCFGAIPVLEVADRQADVVAAVLVSPPLVLPGAGRREAVREKVHEVANRSTLRALIVDGPYRRWFTARIVALTTARARAWRRGGRRRGEPSPPAAGGPPVGGFIVERELRGLLRKGVGIEVVYGSADRNYELARDSPPAWELLGGASGSGRRRSATATLSLIDGPVHGLEDVAVQERLIEIVTARARALAR